MGHKVDARSDLFSVGIILYELVTGEKPFAGEALSAVMHNVIKVNPVAPRELNFAVNECLSRVIMKALSKDPNERYQDGSAMAAALRECLKENPDPSITHVGTVPPRAPVGETIVAKPVTVGETVLKSGCAGRSAERADRRNAGASGKRPQHRDACAVQRDGDGPQCIPTPNADLRGKRPHSAPHRGGLP